MPKTPLPANEAFAKAYATDAALRDETIQALADACRLVEFPDKAPASWQEVLDLIAGDMGQPTVEVMNRHTMPGAAADVYALAAYGWDGGSAINSQHLNLTEIVSAHVEGGPCATLVTRTDPSYPGIALHYAEGAKRLTIQLF